MPNEKNLVPYQYTSDQNREEAAKNGRKGGKASGAARRRKRSLREAADLLLSMPVSDRRAWNKIARMGIDPSDVDNQMAMLVGLMQAGAQGDAKAAKLVFDALGEEDKGSGDVVKIIDDIPTPPEEEADGK